MHDKVEQMLPLQPLLLQGSKITSDTLLVIPKYLQISQQSYTERKMKLIQLAKGFSTDTAPLLRKQPKSERCSTFNGWHLF